MRATRNLAIVLALSVFIAAACAKSTSETDDGNDPSSSTSSASGGAGQGGATGGGGSGGSSACIVDCSGITTSQCTEAVCNEASGQCEVVDLADATPCDDGVFCTTADECQAGACVGTMPNDCGMPAGPCDEIVCDESSSSCSTQPLANGTSCQGTDLCITGGTCSSGACVGGAPVDCFFFPVPDDCHVGECNPLNGMCEAVIGNEGGPCVDANDLCTVSKTCTAGVCQGGMPKNCSALTMGCNTGVCDTASGNCTTMAVGNGMPCDDLDACTTGEICNASVCGGGAPVTNCSQTPDACCPSNCTETNDIDCAYACDDLIGIDSGRNMYTVDKLTAATTLIGMAGSAASTTAGLAQDPITKTVYLTSTGNDSLFTLDVSTGNVTLVGAYGDTAIVMHGLEWDSSTNTLYGYSYHNGGLYTISTATGVATLVGVSGVAGFGNLGYDSLNNVLYMTSGGTDSLYVMNRANGAATLVGPMGGGTSNPQALAYDRTTDTLYLIDTSSDLLYTLNRSTGTATPVGTYGTMNMLGLTCYDAP